MYAPRQQVFDSSMYGLERDVLVLYTGERAFLEKIRISPISPRMTLPGNLTVKNVGNNTVSLQQDFGGVGNIYTVHPDGHGAVRFYGLGEGKDKDKKTHSW